MRLLATIEGLIGTVLSKKGIEWLFKGSTCERNMSRRSQEAPKGRIVEIERPIHISNLKVCVEEDTAAKLNVRLDEQGDRQFVYYKGIKRRSIVQ